MNQSVGIEEISVAREGHWLVVNFPKPMIALSWAVLGGGKKLVRSVAWLRVTGKDLEPTVDPSEYLRGRVLRELERNDVVGLLTSADLDSYADVQKKYGEYEVRCIATVGLSNAVRVGDPPAALNRIGTINLLCVVSHPLSIEAQLEALSIVSEARTAALLIEGRIESPLSFLPATGTGTDCFVVAAPESAGADRGAKYAGKHTVLGHLIGACAYESVACGIERWKKANAFGCKDLR